MTLESTPQDATHWSTRSLAAASGRSRSTVNRIWRALCPAAAPHRNLQIIERPAVHREGARYRWVVSEPAGPRSGALRGREVSNPGSGPHAAATSDATGTTGTAHARLCPSRDHVPVRRSRCEHRKRSSANAIAGIAARSFASFWTPSTRPFLKHLGCTSDSGQLRYAQNCFDPTGSPSVPAFMCTLRPPARPDQPGWRALHWRVPTEKANPSWCPSHA